MGITITEALAEINTIGKRITKKREFVNGCLYRQEQLKDPLEKEGGSRSAIEETRQSIGDLEQRVVDLRRGIARANADTTLTVLGEERTIADWLTWRRDVAPGQQSFINQMVRNVGAVRKEAMQKGLAVVSGEAQSPSDIVVNVNEMELAVEAEGMEETLGTLDGLLSLKNATVTIEL